MKYVLTNNTKTINGHKLYQICAIENKGIVKAGELGGFIENTGNLSQDDLCWIAKGSVVYGCSHISDDTRVVNSTIIDTDVFGSSYVCGSRLENSVIHDSHIAGTKVIESHLMCVRCFGERPATLYDCQLRNTELTGPFTFECVEIEAPCRFTGPIHMRDRRLRIPIVLHTGDELHIDREWTIDVYYKNDECAVRLVNRDTTKNICRTIEIDHQTWG